MKMADVYSIGLVFFEVVCEEEPFGDLNIHQMHKQVGENGKKVSFQVPRIIVLIITLIHLVTIFKYIKA